MPCTPFGVCRYGLIGVLVAVVAVGCDGSGASPPALADGAAPDADAAGALDTDGPVSLVGRGFDVEWSISQSDMCFGSCTPATLFVRGATETSLSIVLGLPGRAITAELEQTALGWSGGLVLEQLPQGYDWCGSSTELANLVLDLSDHDEDGVIDLEGSTDRVRTQCSDDTPASVSTQSVQLHGQPDATLPVAPMPSAGGLNGIWFGLSEPLVPSASATATGPLGELPLAPILENDYVVGFSSPVFQPFGAELHVSFDGSDLAQVGAPLPLVITTGEDFGVLSQDGFESGSLSGVSGAAEIVDGLGAEPAITGSKMLLVQPGSPVHIRLQRSGTETTIAMKTRALSYCYSPLGDVSFHAGVIGGTQLASTTLAAASFTPLPPGNAVVAIGVTETTVLSIPEPGSDVVMMVFGEGYHGAGCAMMGVLIDDLHLE
jgi:hypothetical protein